MSNIKDCYCGTPWVSMANTFIASRISESLEIVTTDAIHPLEMLNPVHHPHIWNSCMNGKECVLNITTVSNTIYDDVDDYNISQNPYISAKAIAVKFKSEESIWEAIIGDNSGISQTDINMCRDINEFALEVAFASLSDSRKELYKQYGEKIVFDPDNEIYLMEPVWSVKPLSIRSGKRDGKNVLIITSQSFKTSVDLKWKNIELMAGNSIFLNL